jgi:hypothetical protein
MPSPRIEDYAFLSDTRSAAMVSRSGSVDWLTFPRFDSPAAMAALVGTQENGHFSISPVGEFRTERRYLPGTLVLETTHTTPNGTAVVTDALAMPHHHRSTPRLLRKVEVTSGRVAMRMELRIRFGYGRIVPWVRRPDHHLLAIGGPDALVLRTSVDVHGEGLATVADFEVGEGTGAWFDLAWFESQNATPPPIAVNDSIDAAFDDTITRWREWSDGITYDRAWSEEVTASAVVLKGLTYAPTGGIVAAPTTSLPEQIGGVRNWDYRYCWLRDATFTLYALVHRAPRSRRGHWREWLLRAVRRDPDKLQIMYGLGRRAPAASSSSSTGWRGTRGARPVRIGNAAPTSCSSTCSARCMDSCTSRVAGIPADRFQRRAPRERCSNTSRRCGSSPTTGSGRSAATSALHPLEGDGVGRVRPGGAQSVRGAVAPGPRRRVESTSATSSTGDLRAGVRRARGSFMQAYGSTSSTPACSRWPSSGSCRPPTPGSSGRSRRSSSTCSRTASSSGTARTHRRGHGRRRARRAPPEGGRVPHVLVLAGRQPRAARAPSRTRPSCSNACSGSPTTWACSPRSTTSR